MREKSELRGSFWRLGYWVMNPVATKEMETCATWVAAGRAVDFPFHKEEQEAWQQRNARLASTLYSIVVAVERICLRTTRLDFVKLVCGCSLPSHRRIAVPRVAGVSRLMGMCWFLGPEP